MMQELNYIRCGDYYIPDIRLPEEARPIGRWGRMHRDYIKEHNPIHINDLCLSGELWTYLADLNEQAHNRLELIIEQMKAAGFKHDMRETTLGHLQRGGVPVAYDRVLASQFGVKAFEMVLNQEYGKMVAYRHPNIISVPLEDAVAKMNFVTMDNDLVKTAMGLGISLGI